MIIKNRIPLLEDHHNHLYLYAAPGNSVDLRPARCEADAFAAIQSMDEARRSVSIEVAAVKYTPDPPKCWDG